MSDNIKKLIVDSISSNTDQSFTNKKDNKSKKKDKKKNNVKNNKLVIDDLNIHGGATRIIDVNDFKHYDKMQWRIRLDVFQWTNRDVALYINEKYFKRYKKPWEASLVAVARHADRIRKALFDVLGFCDNVVIKDYIDYFFNFWSDFFCGPKKILRFKSLLNSDAVQEFVEDYNYSERIKSYTDGNDSAYKGKLPALDIDKVNMSYKLGLDNLILDYGIILSVNYLIKNGKDHNTAIKLVSDSVARICKNSDFNIIIQITNAYSPYSSQMLFIDDKILIETIERKISKKMNFNISFLENLNRWEYFEHEHNDEQ